MTEERWHNFAKEKPSEDMEGRNFIVSNGHYEKIATWCGYWENEPFMGDRLCDEVVRWKFYFTPEEEKANDETRTEPKAMKCDELEEYYYYEDRVVTPATHMYRVYHADKVDAAIAELKARIQLDDDEMAGFLQLEEECGGGDLRKYIAELKAKLEGAKNETNYWCNNLKVFAQKKDAEIAELKAQKAQAEDDCAYWKMSEGNAANAMHETEEYAMQLYKEAQHHKYKRCLAMAEWCKARYDEEDARINGHGASWEYISLKMKYWERWQWRWEELAEEPTWEKFLQLIHKEAK